MSQKTGGVKNISYHTENPSLSYGELLSILSEEGLKKHDLRKRNIRQKNKKTHKKVSPAKLELKNKEREQEVVCTKGKKGKIKKEKNITTSVEKEGLKDEATHKEKIISQKNQEKRNKVTENFVTSPAKEGKKSPTKTSNEEKSVGLFP